MDVSSALSVNPLTVHDLPYEILDKIFSQLGVHDVGRCMMVSKRWNFIGSKLKINEIIFKNTDKYHEWYNKWITKELFDKKMVVNCRYLSKPLPLNTTFLRRLSLHPNKDHNFQLDYLNKFLHLEHLEVTNFNKRSQLQRITFLNLPNLNILHCCSVDCKVVFNTPVLNAVHIKASSEVRFRNLPTLKLLECDSFLHNERENFHSFNRIKSVEVFQMQSNINLQFIYTVLAELNELKEVRWYLHPLPNAIAISREYFEEWVAVILEKRRSLDKTNVKIYLLDILLEDGKAFDEYGFEDVDRLHLY